jgi:2-methylfumaryl-CoA hydratase
LENVLGVLALNGGSHVAPTFAGDTLCCATTVVERIAVSDSYVGALRLRTVGAVNLDGPQHIMIAQPGPAKATDAPGVVLDLDYTVAIPKRPKR